MMVDVNIVSWMYECYLCAMHSLYIYVWSAYSVVFFMASLHGRRFGCYLFDRRLSVRLYIRKCIEIRMKGPEELNCPLHMDVEWY